MVGEIFSVQAYQHLLTVVSSMITRKLNPRVYDSLLVLLDAVCWYRVYRLLDTLPLYLYYELLINVVSTFVMHKNIFSMMQANKQTQLAIAIQP